MPALAAHDAAGGEIRALDDLHELFALDLRVLNEGIAASQTSERLWGGMLVAMPTAMPEEPLTSRLGTFAGMTVGSVVVPSKVGGEVDRVLVDVGHHLFGDLSETRLGVTIGGRGVAVDRSRSCLGRR